MKRINRVISRLLAGDRRTVKMKKNIYAMFGVKGLSIIFSLLYIPLMLKAVTQTEYGVLLTLTTIVQWVGMLDIGIGNGLRNKLTTALSNNDMNTARTLVSSSYVIFMLLALVMIIGFLIISPLISWQNILNTSGCSESELLILARVVFVAFCIQLPLGLVNSVLLANQMPAINSILLLVSNLCSLLGVLFAVYCFDIHSIIIIGAITCLSHPIVLLVASIILYRSKFNRISPLVSLYRNDSVSDIISLGIKFFVLQIVTIILYQANNIIISHIVNPAAVVQYNIAYKYIGVITMVYTVIVSPVWSATTDAYARGDKSWIISTASKLKKVSIISMIIGIIMVLLSKFTYQLWLGAEYIDIDYSITGLVFVYVSFKMLFQNYGAIINGIGKLKAQMVFTSIIAVIYIPLSLFLGNKWKLEGVLLGSVIVQLLNFIWSKIQYNKIMNNKTSKFWTS